MFPNCRTVNSLSICRAINTICAAPLIGLIDEWRKFKRKKNTHLKPQCVIELTTVPNWKQVTTITLMKINYLSLVRTTNNILSIDSESEFYYCFISNHLKKNQLFSRTFFKNSIRNHSMPSIRLRFTLVAIVVFPFDGKTCWRLSHCSSATQNENWCSIYDLIHNGRRRYIDNCRSRNNIQCISIWTPQRKTRNAWPTNVINFNQTTGSEKDFTIEM